MELSQAEQAACTRAENSGWRYALYTIGAITLFIFFVRFLLFNFRESPAYLINKGHDQEALRVLYSIAKLNKAPQPQLTLEDFGLIENHCNERDRRARRLSDPESIAGSELAKPTATATTVSDSGDPFTASSEQQRRSVVVVEDKEAQFASETHWQTFKRALRESGAQLKGVRLLFRDKKLARITILLWLTYMAE